VNVEKVLLMKFSLTHKGWFGFCPVYCSDPTGFAPLIIERHWLFEPLMIASELLFDLCLWARALAGVDANGWVLTITGELDPPRELEVGTDTP